jgi:hypothetical protein
LLLVAGDANQAARQLKSGITSSRRLAFWTALPTCAVLALVLFVPWSVLRAVPGGRLVIEPQEQRLKEALGQDALRAVAGAIRYVDANMAFEEGARTPLMLARSAEVAQVLLDQGASVNERLSTNADTTALSIARERHTEEAVAALLKAGAMDFR